MRTLFPTPPARALGVACADSKLPSLPLSPQRPPSAGSRGCWARSCPRMRVGGWWPKPSTAG